ncbi:MAG: helix-turn-helix transcriptional regulator [Clostridia bacterium]|nr:helix-turn-helix transcriptional regulator [Clostridia bacterium]
MEKNFPLIITELRKSRGISQKEAAEKLGISQALLSHYEKGIRECGQSFLVRIADFYDVSVDYLLGRENTPNRVSSIFASLDESAENWETNDLSLMRAAIQLREHLRRRDPQLGDLFIRHLSVQLYRLILQQARQGNLPKNWAGVACSDGELFANNLYLQLIDQAQMEEIDSRWPSRPAAVNEPAPEAVRSVVSRAEDYVFGTLADYLPPLPTKYLK